MNISLPTGLVEPPFGGLHNNPWIPARRRQQTHLPLPACRKVKIGTLKAASAAFGNSMARYDIRTPRLYTHAALGAGMSVALEQPQAHYLLHVLRLKAGDAVLLFNGQDGEWRARLENPTKRSVSAQAEERTRAQTPPSDLHYWFAPLKHSRLDYMAQKAVEMGAARLQPVITRHTQAARVNLDRMRANAVEAAEQCGILALPEIGTPSGLEQALTQREPSRLLVFCDEDAEVKDPVAALQQVRDGRTGAMPLALLIGPEGGFAEDERAMLLRIPNVLRLALGPRILRADTAAVAALALVQAVLGDWR
jgi:16S rRNA (uracil1498-N3)-methyltransferase